MKVSRSTKLVPVKRTKELQTLLFLVGSQAGGMHLCAARDVEGRKWEEETDALVPVGGVDAQLARPARARRRVHVLRQLTVRVVPGGNTAGEVAPAPETKADTGPREREVEQGHRCRRRRMLRAGQVRARVRRSPRQPSYVDDVTTAGGWEGSAKSPFWGRPIGPLPPTTC